MTYSQIAKALLHLKLMCLNTEYCGDCPFCNAGRKACGLESTPWDYDEQHLMQVVDGATGSFTEHDGESQVPDGDTVSNLFDDVLVKYETVSERTDN